MKCPIASLSLDLDNQWSYMKTHGDEGWDQFPSYFDTVVPRMLSIFDELDLKLTAFVVGKDASLKKNHAALRQIADAGHEIANHSFWHEPWFHLYDAEATEKEIIEAEEAIETATGVRPRGWRGPGFSFSPALLKILAQRGYDYDASTFPTFLGPIARLFYFMKSGLGRAEREQRGKLYGGFLDALRPLKPFRWSLGSNCSLLEIPVTTMPIFRVPIHASYLLYLATFSPVVARLYLRLAVGLCKLTRTGPSFLLHPTDFLGGDDVPVLSYFPAMNRDGEWKQARMREFLSILSTHFQFLPMGAYARQVESETETNLLKLQPSLS